MPDGERRLAAIMFTDMVGYTALTQSNESLALQVLERHNRLLRPFFPRFHGREVKAIGDSFLVEFGSALDAIGCALEIQSYLHDYNAASKDEWKIKLRIGIHLGDVVHSGGDVFGDAVNIASRIEPVAEPEGICVSEPIFGQIRNKISTPLMKLPQRDLKNIQFPMDVYKVVMPWEKPGPGIESIPRSSNRIAILPLVNLSPDPADEFFADGMTEEIISTASGISGLSVISRTSVMGYKNTTKKVREIGNELECGSVLEGSFRKAGNRIRITTQLIDVAADQHLWAQTYDRQLDDVFAVQSDIAKQVADSLRVRILTPEIERLERKPTESTAAYTLYLKGRYVLSKRGLEDTKKAADYFEQSIKEDPKSALGYAGLGDSCELLFSNWGVDGKTNHEKAKAMISRALELDPELAEAHASMGLIHSNDLDLKGAEREFRRAIELKPSYAFAHMWYYRSLGYQMRWDEALAQIDKAVELDPLSPVTNLNLGDYYANRRDYRKAAEVMERVVELHPAYVAAHGWLGYAYGKQKRYDDMNREFEAWIGILENRYPLARKAAELVAAFLKDDKQAVRTLLPELEAHLEETPLNMETAAGFYFYLGEIEKGFELLERSYSKREPDILSIKVDEALDSVRSDPRYLDLVARLGLG